MNIREYALRKEEHLKVLPQGPAFVTSRDTNNGNSKAGVVCEVYRDVAAGLLANGSHDLAKPEEVEAYHRDLKARTDVLTLDAMAKKQQSVLNIPEDSLKSLFSMFQQALVPAQSQEPAQTAPSRRGGNQ